ncbi:hypothetical protein, partial [Xenorhabdus cabanillasii]|uniref:hypothetical protein n=1 Tax=Xenorhabdus cabanillasii TaxID=351673 RepID=UPI002795A3E4
NNNDENCRITRSLHPHIGLKRTAFSCATRILYLGSEEYDSFQLQPKNDAVLDNRYFIAVK